MEVIDKRLVGSIVESQRLYRSAEHLISVTFPVVKDTKLLLRGLESLHKSLVLAIGNILKFEHIYGRVSLGKDKDRNLRVFFLYCAMRYGMNEEDKEIIKEILFMGKKHKESGMEFSRDEKLIILDDDMKEYELRQERMKVFLDVVKRILDNSRLNFKTI
jgi:hypothetical protein